MRYAFQIPSPPADLARMAPVDAAPDALNLLLQERLDLRTRLHRYLDDRARGLDDEAATQRVRQIGLELRTHLHRQESLVFPALRLVLVNSELLDQSEVEDGCLVQLLERLASMSADEPLFDATVAVAADHFALNDHHVRDALLPLAAARLPRSERGHLGEAWLEARRLTASTPAPDGLPTFENEDADPVGARTH